MNVSDCHLTGSGSRSTRILNALRPRQNGHHFADICKCILLNENVWITINLSLKFVLERQISNIPLLVQIMAWRQLGDKPLSEPMMTKFGDAYMRHSASMSWLQYICLFDSDSSISLLCNKEYLVQFGVILYQHMDARTTALQSIFWKDSFVSNFNFIEVCCNEFNWP